VTALPRPLILAHRGWSARYPENTLLAFVEALQLGSDGLEFDVQVTADGVPVIIHDPTVDRTTDGKGPVSHWRLQDLRRLNAAKGFENWPDVGRQRIPTLTEVLDAAHALHPAGCYNIELKVYDNDGRALVDRAVPACLHHPLGRRILFSSFHHGALEYLKRRYPRAKIGLLFADRDPEPWRKAMDLGAVSVHLLHSHADPDVIKACQTRGVRVALWTVDEPDDIRRCLRLGVDMLITNVPDTALRLRDGRGPLLPSNG
jgi:glycerophosphoryl diester phosphodiesterase